MVQRRTVGVLAVIVDRLDDRAASIVLFDRVGNRRDQATALVDLEVLAARLDGAAALLGFLSFRKVFESQSPGYFRLARGSAAGASTPTGAADTPPLVAAANDIATTKPTTATFRYEPSLNIHTPP
jgi:hypothetical protein